MRWTKKDLEKVNLPHNLTEKSRNKLKKINLPSKRNAGKDHIKTILWALKEDNKIPEYIEEHKFHPTRRWRFDWAIPDMKVAIEYEGIISEKSRHTTLQGFSGDCDKYNEAGKLGWTVLRYTALNYKNLANDLHFFICKK